MARRFPLQFVLEHSQSRLDDAAKRLAQLKAQWQLAEEKLTQLEAYRRDYGERMGQTARAGMSVMALRDYQLFLAKLDGAIETQRAEVARCRGAWEEGRAEWLVCRGKLKAFQALEQRHTAREAVREARLEQKEQDESARRSAAKKTP
jgi:flagellar FliJ protein